MLLKITKDPKELLLIKKTYSLLTEIKLHGKYFPIQKKKNPPERSGIILYSSSLFNVLLSKRQLDSDVLPHSIYYRMVSGDQSI